MKDSVKHKLNDILLSVSWADVSRQYFGKPNAWLYHKLEGADHDGKPVEFTAEEMAMLKGALTDLADRIRTAADQLP